MKSIKKRFRAALAEVERAANDLLLISADVTLLGDVQELAGSVLEACGQLESRAAQLRKVDFVECMREEPVLRVLDEFVDSDVLSVVEERLSLVVVDEVGGQAGELLRQLLDKLENRLALLNEAIQQLGGLLNEEG